MSRYQIKFQKTEYIYFLISNKNLYGTEKIFRKSNIYIYIFN